jgi:hypothetical protein
MLTRQNLALAFLLSILATSASADPVVYVVTQNQSQFPATEAFGTVDLSTGAFRQIGSNLPQGESGLVWSQAGSLLTLDYSGNLDAINPATGAMTLVNSTGLGDQANTLGQFGGTLYATDLSNNLYTIDSAGVAHFKGATGIPAVPFVPGTGNPDGTINIFNETLLSANGKMYATFDADSFDPAGPAISPVLGPTLYQIDPVTAQATAITPTTALISASVELDGTVYSFVGDAFGLGHVTTLDVSSGKTSLLSDVDPSAGLIFGAATVPEPTPIALAAAGTLMILLWKRRRTTGGL